MGLIMRLIESNAEINSMTKVCEQMINREQSFIIRTQQQTNVAKAARGGGVLVADQRVADADLQALPVKLNGLCTSIGDLPPRHINVPTWSYDPMV